MVDERAAVGKGFGELQANKTTAVAEQTQVQPPAPAHLVHHLVMNSPLGAAGAVVVSTVFVVVVTSSISLRIGRGQTGSIVLVDCRDCIYGTNSVNDEEGDGRGLELELVLFQQSRTPFRKHQPEHSRSGTPGNYLKSREPGFDHRRVRVCYSTRIHHGWQSYR